MSNYEQQLYERQMREFNKSIYKDQQVLFAKLRNGDDIKSLKHQLGEVNKHLSSKH